MEQIDPATHGKVTYLLCRQKHRLFLLVLLLSLFTSAVVLEVNPLAIQPLLPLPQGRLCARFQLGVKVPSSRCGEWKVNEINEIPLLELKLALNE